MYPTRATAMLKLWHTVHVGRPVRMERDEDETPRGPPAKAETPPHQEVTRFVDPLGSAAGS
jgi:hypothetical protein